MGVSHNQPKGPWYVVCPTSRGKPATVWVARGGNCGNVKVTVWGNVCKRQANQRGCEQPEPGNGTKQRKVRKRGPNQWKGGERSAGGAMCKPRGVGAVRKERGYARSVGRRVWVLLATATVWSATGSARGGGAVVGKPTSAA